MSTFRFRAQSVLEWRRRLADTARGEVIRTGESVRASVATADAADARHTAAVDDYRRELIEGCEAGAVPRHRTWIDRERAHVAACQAVVVARQHDADAATLVLQQAMRDVKVMEKLQERLAQRHREKEREAELRDLNERATLQFTRRRSEVHRGSRPNGQEERRGR